MDDSQTSTPTNQEDPLSKYKRLLSLARSSLEANQVALAEKDKQIIALKTTLENERQANGISIKRLSVHNEEDNKYPRSIIRRVDVDDNIWILVDYDRKNEEEWLRFGNENELSDYLQRVSGEPLVLPPKSLSPKESEAIEIESKKRVDRIVEEFRRYKVRSEIARKQRDIDEKQNSHRNNVMGGSSTTTTSGKYLISTDKNESSIGDTTTTSSALGFDTSREEILKYQLQLSELDAKWKSVYEQLARENEQLRSRDDDSRMVSQWRARYETCKQERDEAYEKLKIFTSSDTASVSGSKSPRRSIEQKFIDLKEEYKEYRRRAQAVDNDRVRQIEDLQDELQHVREKETDRPTASYKGTGSSSTSTGSTNMEAAKLLHLRHLIVQFLSHRKDSDVRGHMEDALMTILRFNETERNVVHERRRQELEANDPMISFINYFGSAVTTPVTMAATSSNT